MNLHLKILFLTLVISNCIFGQSDTTLNILNTHCSITVPKTYLYPGGRIPCAIYQAKKANICVLESAKSYSTVLFSYSTDSLAKRNITVTSSDKIELNGVEALFITGIEKKSYAENDVQFLIFGGLEYNCVVQGSSPVSENLKEEIKTAILSTKYSKDSFNEIVKDFTIKLNWREIMPNSYMRTVEHSDFPDYFTITSLTIPVPDSLKSNIKNSITTSYTEKGYKIISIVPITIDGLSGFETIAEKMLDNPGKIQRFYIVNLYHEKGSYTLQGQTSNHFKQTTKQFRKIASTFKRLN